MAEQQNAKQQNAKEPDTNQLLKVRREKLADLQAAGKDPFQITKYNQTHHSVEVKKLYDEHEAKILAGRAPFSAEGMDEAQAKEALERVCDRARATEAPEKGNYKLLLSGKNVRTLIDFYIDRSSSGMVYPGYSGYQAGMDVQGEKVQGEKLNITLHASNPYSSEGIPMKDLTLLKEGELKAIHGNARFAYYLGVEPTGIYSAVKLDNGTKTLEEMKKEPYLYVVSFSDFSMDSLSGYFGGEIRLAYLFDGEKVTPVTGGSVSGNLLELQKDMAFSTERYKDKDYDGPFAVEFHGVAVAGK